MLRALLLSEAVSADPAWACRGAASETSWLGVMPNRMASGSRVDIQSLAVPKSRLEVPWEATTVAGERSCLGLCGFGTAQALRHRLRHEKVLENCWINCRKASDTLLDLPHRQGGTLRSKGETNVCNRVPSDLCQAVRENYLVC